MRSSAPTVVVGMSGGVDSSVSALLLKQQGYNVIGLYMKNWEDSDGSCPSVLEYEDVMRVCEQIDIPYYSVNFVDEYWNNVFSQCLQDFERGITPNPDILCNREIKFNALLKKAEELGADFLATGHYCQIVTHEGRLHLAKGADPSKDQSYFLYTLKEELLPKILFPVGGMLKSQVRAIAQQNQLHTANKKDSTGICFIGERRFKEFLSQFIQPKPGNFEDLQGNIIGQHDGIAFYTIGQRRGIGIGGAGEPWFVAAKDISRNVIILAQGTNNPALFSSSTIIENPSWISSPPPTSCHCKIRYRQHDQPCTIQHLSPTHLQINFHTPQRAVTPGQSIVFYHNSLTFGGGALPLHPAKG